MANERGSPPQRLISHFLDALVTRQQGRGAERYTMGLNVSAQEMAASMERCFSSLPYVDFCHVAAFDSLLKVAVGQRRLHILVFGFWMSHHWVKLLQVGFGVQGLRNALWHVVEGSQVADGMTYPA